MTIQSKLYLIPNLISENDIDFVIPNSLKIKILEIKHYIVENIREARRFLKKLNKEINIDELTFYEINKNIGIYEVENYLDETKNGIDFGLISDAGLPCVADPGNIIVAKAHEKGIKVVPCVGPSSIFLALMASGLNGQNFAFNGYLPIDKTECTNKIKSLELRSKIEKQTQIFMDTPYRNNKLLDLLLSTLQLDTKLCIACNITATDEFIQTKPIYQWKTTKPDLNKKPCIFLI